MLLQPPESTELATCVLCASPLIFGCLCGNLWMINFSPLLERRKDDAIFVPCLFIQRVSEWATPTQGTLFSGFGIPLDLFILLSRCWIQLIWFASLSSSSISVAYKVSSPLVYLLKSSRSGSLDTKSGMFSFKSRERERDSTRDAKLKDWRKEGDGAAVSKECRLKPPDFHWWRRWRQRAAFCFVFFSFFRFIWNCIHSATTTENRDRS